MSTTNIAALIINATQAVGAWVPRERGIAASLFPADGAFQFTVTEQKAGLSREKQQPMISAMFRCEDKDAQGCVATKHFVLDPTMREPTGGRKEKWSMMDEFFSYLYSRGESVENVKRVFSQPQSLESIIKYADGLSKTCYALMKAKDEPQYGAKSEVSGWLLKSEYDRKVENGLHRQPHGFKKGGAAAGGHDALGGLANGANGAANGAANGTAAGRLNDLIDSGGSTVGTKPPAAALSDDLDG